MKISQKEVDELVAEYIEITGINCKGVFMQSGVNHSPTILASNEKGVYVFLYDDSVFKVGKSTAKPRWNSNHYNYSKGQNRLANLILDNTDDFKSYFNETKQFIIDELTPDNIKEWIHDNLSRIEFKISSKESVGALNLLEGFLQFKLNPIYEKG